MTYHPRQILTCALFLATKTDHWHIPLSTFVDRIPKTEEKDVRAPEFLLMQGLRFTLDVRHPMRGLEGGIGEILKLIEEGVLSLDEDQHEDLRHGDPKLLVGKAADRASHLLRGAAQMTDVYFLYTPSQIWLAALMAAHPNLANKYLSVKIARMGATTAASKNGGGSVAAAARSYNGTAEELYARIQHTIRSCADTLLSSDYRSEEEKEGKGETAGNDSMKKEKERKEMKKEMKRIGRKLHQCQNPEKMDLVAVTRQKKADKRREGNESDQGKLLKKRKLEEEKLEQQQDAAVFGPPIPHLQSLDSSGEGLKQS